jgi:hypothetical protein
LESLLPLAEMLVSSAMDSEQKSANFEKNWLTEKLLRQSDNESRMKEIASWQAISETLSNRVTTLSLWLLDFGILLGDFSGSEAEKHARAMAALDEIKAGAARLELESRVWKDIAIGGGVVGAAGLVYFVGHALGAW